MKRSFKLTAVTVVLLLVISLSLNIVFALGQGVEPGSSQDPIVSKSYVDAAVAQLTAKIQTLLEQNDTLKNQNAGLTTRVTSQEQVVKALQEELKIVKANVAAGTGNSAGAGTSTGNTGSTGSTGNTTTPVTPTKPTTPAASIGKGIVNVAVLNVRSQPNTTSSIVAKAVKNETLTLVSKSGDWYKVTTAKGITAYVMSTYITVTKY